MAGDRHEALNIYSAAIAGPTKSPVVSGTPSHVREEIAAEERCRRLLIEKSRLPAVGHVWHIKIAHSLAAEIDHLAVRKYARWSVGRIVKRDEARGLAMSDFCHRSRREPLVHGPTFIGLIMTEGNLL